LPELVPDGKIALCRKTLGVKYELKQELPDTWQGLYEVLTWERIILHPFVIT